MGLLKAQEMIGDCIEVKSNVDKDGYPRMKTRGKTIKLTHYLWERVHGYKPSMMCHHCDNPSCINLNHIYEGTLEQNMADKVNRRRIHGERNPNYNHDVDMDLVVRLYEGGWSQACIGAVVGLAQSTVSQRLKIYYAENNSDDR